MIKRLFCILLSLALLACAAVSLAEETVMEAPAADAAPTEAPAEQAPVLLVTVNGSEIYDNDPYLQNVLQYYLSQMDPSDPSNTIIAQQYAMNYNIMINHLAKAKVAELGLDQFTDEEKAAFQTEGAAEWDQIVESYIPQVNPDITADSTEEEKAAARADAEAYILANFNVSKDDYVLDYIAGQTESTALERLVAQLSPGDVSDEDVENYFNDLVADDKEEYGDDAGMYEFYKNYYGIQSYYMPEGYRGITHILLKPDQALMDNLADLYNRLEEQNNAEESVPTGDQPEASGEPEATPEAEPTEEPTPTPEPVTEEMIKAAEDAILANVQPRIDEINAKLKEGVSFDELIKEYGEDPGMQNDANRAEGYPVHENSIVWDPAFTAAAMALEKIGDISEPVIGSSGVHILHYLRDIPGGPVELTAELKESLRQELKQEQDEAALAAALEQWEAEASIIYTEEGLKWKMPDPEPTDEPEEEAAEATPEAPETAPETTPAP